MKRLALALAALVALTADASAAMWSVDHAKSKLWFEAQWSGKPFAGTFGKWQAVIDFDPANLPASKATVTVDLASIATDEDDLTSGLKGPMGFAIAQFPTATFVTSSITSAGAGKYVANGTLTIHGIRKQIQLPFSLTIAGTTAHMTGAANIMRTDWKVGNGSSMGMDWGADNPVSRAVQIKVDLTATKL